jgi:O-antigen ligase/Tfp pilus assembly protein PilF
MTLRDFLRFIVLACTFATPFICLFVAETMFFPFITGKNFTFRILVEIMLGAWALLMFIDAAYRPKFSWILVAAGTFLGVIALADFNGVNPFRSFWSNYERMEGLVTHIHLFLYFVIAGSVLTTEELWNWFWRTSLGASLIVVIYAFTQIAGKTEMHGRVDATFGNSTYLGVYALFHAFIATFLYVRSKKQNGLSWLYPVTALLNLTILFYTGTRGTVVGLIAAMALTLILVAFFDKEHQKLKKYAMGGLVAMVVIIGIFFSFKHSAFIQGSPILARVAAITDTGGTANSRFMIWRMSWEGFKERPLLGWGQDNFLYVFSKHYDPNMYNQEPWFDRSHNVFFDWLIAGGALGLLAYLSLFAAGVYHLWFSRKLHFTILERSIFIGMFAGYFIHNIFVFDNLTSYILFFGMLAYIHALGAKTPEHEKNAPVHKLKKGEGLETGDLVIAGAVIAVLTFGMVYFVNIRNIEANVALINGIRPEGVMVPDGQNSKKIALGDVVDPELFGTGEVREQIVQLSMQTLDPRVPQQIKKQFYDLAVSQFDIALKEDPDNLRTQSFAAMFYARFGNYEQALKHYQKSIELSPRRQSTHLDLSMTYVAMNRYADAEVSAKTAYDLQPANNEAQLAYATVLIYLKKVDQATAIVGTSSNAYDARIINAYGVGGYFDKVIELVNEKIALGQAGGRDYFSLAGAYAQIGQKEKALAAVEKAVSIDSSLKEQGDKLIQQINIASIIKK